MDFTGRPMRGYVFVEAQGLKTDTMLARWIQRGESFARPLPPGKKNASRAKG